MPKNPPKQQVKRKTPEEVVSILAEKYGMTERYVQMVISGDRQHENILADYLWFRQENNQLLKQVEQLVPFYN